MARVLLRMLGRLLAWPLALLVLFEEWGWDPLQRALARLAQRLHLQWLGDRIERLPPYGALALFAIPTLLLLPVKLAALGLVAAGHLALGTAVIVGAKLAGTALVARLYALTRPALLQLAWFARLHGRWVRWKEALLAPVRASWPWRQGRVLRRQLRRRWAAARR